MLSPSSALLKVETRGETDAINQYVFERAKQAIAGAATMYAASYKLHLMGAATSSAPSPATYNQQLMKSIKKLELRYTMLLEKVVEPFQKSKLILLETQVKNNLIHSEIAIVPTVAISYFPTPNNRCQKDSLFSGLFSDLLGNSESCSCIWLSTGLDSLSGSFWGTDNFFSLFSAISCNCCD